jgi:hypothetical protein
MNHLPTSTTQHLSRIVGENFWYFKYRDLFNGQTFHDIKVLHRAMRIAKKGHLAQAGAVAFYTIGAVASIIPNADVRPIVRGNQRQWLPGWAQIANTVRGEQMSEFPIIQSAHDAYEWQVIWIAGKYGQIDHQKWIHGILEPRMLLTLSPFWIPTILDYLLKVLK